MSFATRVRRIVFTLTGLCVIAAGALGADETRDARYEGAPGFEPVNFVDVCVLAGLRRHEIEPSPLCSDATFVRRVHLDVTGTLPDPVRVAAFLADEREDKRARLIDELLAREAYADLWTLKWCDLLRVKAEFPINLWPNGVQAYRRWIFDAVRENRPYDRWARELLTSSGSNFREPAVNFYRAVQDRSPAGLAAAVALTFMGTRFETLSPAQRDGMAAFFSRVVYKATDEWKEEVVIDDPAPRAPFTAALPDGKRVEVGPDDDPRAVFARWLVDGENRWFARNLVNRAWAWLMGRGVVHEPDDLREDNPPSNPALLARLERSFIESGYDVKQLFRSILRSRTYQGSCVPRSESPEAAALFAYYPVRRLDAEVLIDALCQLDGSGEDYLSQVPEPFTILRGLKRTVRLADGSTTSPFLEMFGRPARDTGLESERTNEPTPAQRLYLLNSTDVQRRIERSGWLRQLVARKRGKPMAIANQVYLTLLSRFPDADELAIAVRHLSGHAKDQRESAVDLVWALLNTKEFLYRH